MKLTKIHCDGGSRGNPGPGAAAFVAYSEDGKVLYKKGEYLGETTNNMAEYKAVILALVWLNSQKSLANPLPFFLDSQLIVNQLNGTFRIKEKKLLELAIEVKSQEKKIGVRIIFNHVLRNSNKDADLLVNKTLDSQHP